MLQILSLKIIHPQIVPLCVFQCFRIFFSYLNYMNYYNVLNFYSMILIAFLFHVSLLLDDLFPYPYLCHYSNSFICSSLILFVHTNLILNVMMFVMLLLCYSNSTLIVMVFIIFLDPYLLVLVFFDLFVLLLNYFLSLFYDNAFISLLLMLNLIYVHVFMVAMCSIPSFHCLTPFFLSVYV